MVASVEVCLPQCITKPVERVRLRDAEKVCLQDCIVQQLKADYISGKYTQKAFIAHRGS